MSKIVRIDMTLEDIDGYQETVRASLSVDENCVSTAYEVATGTTDGVISLEPVTTASVIALNSDQTITYKLNGSATAVTLNAGGWALFFNTSITALTVTNASGSTAVLKRLAWGT